VQEGWFGQDKLAAKREKKTPRKRWVFGEAVDLGGARGHGGKPGVGGF